MKKIAITFSILFLVAFMALGQASTISPQTINIVAYDGADASINAIRSNGTAAAPTPVTNGRVLLAITGRGNGGGSPTFFNAAIKFIAEENFTLSSRATGIRFETTAPGQPVPALRMSLSANGNLAIGNLTPNAPLQFLSVAANRKIVMFEQANNDHQVTGFGVGGGLRYQIPNTGESHIFYAGTSASSSNELMRITGNGNVGIGISNPVTARLEINAGDLNGIYSQNNSASSPTAKIENLTSGGNSLEISGGIKVSGSSPAALQLVANSNVFSLIVPTTSANAITDLLFITRTTSNAGPAHSAYYAKWTGSDWEIRREDAGTIAAGTLINVLVIKQ